MPNPAKGIEVRIAESNERWSELTLEDGTVIRVKQNVASVILIPDEYDSEGRPVYVVNSVPAVVIVSVAEELRRKVN